MDDIAYGVRIGIFDVHGQTQVRGFDIRGLIRADPSGRQPSSLNQSSV